MISWTPVARSIRRPAGFGARACAVAADAARAIALVSLRACAIAAAISAIAIGAAPHPARATTILVPASYRTWKIGNGSPTGTTSQWIVPLQITQPLSARVDLALEAAVQGGSDDAAGIGGLSGRPTRGRASSSV